MRKQMEAEVMTESRRSSIVEKKMTTEKVKDQFLFSSFCSLLSVSFVLITPLSVLLINVVINVRKELLCVNLKEFRLTNRNSKYRVWVRPSCKWLEKANNT